MSERDRSAAGRPTTDQVAREAEGVYGGRWAIVVDGHEAEMTYSRASPGLVVINHTGVPAAIGGRGIGQLLMTRAVEDARREGFRIRPACSFAAAQFRRHPEWGDVLSG